MVIVCDRYFIWGAAMRKAEKFFAVLLFAVLASPAYAIMGTSCNSTGSGVGGMISDTDDIVQSLNCLGKQIADVRSNMPLNAMMVESEQSTGLNRLDAQTSYLKNKLDDIESRLAAIERRLAGVDLNKAR